MTVCKPLDRGGDAGTDWRIEAAWRCLERGDASLEQFRDLAQQIRGDLALAEDVRARQLERLGVVIWAYSTREYDGY